MTSQDKQDLLDFVADHIENFDTVPLEYQTASGELIPYHTVWRVCEEAGILTALSFYN